MRLERGGQLASQVGSIHGGVMFQVPGVRFVYRR